MGDNSDYDLPRTKMHELLPEPYDSEVNRAVFENLFNRFLTKTDTERVSGYIGQGNPDALISRQISEPTIARQANQLQPVLYNKIGSIDHITTWKDILNELERLGVDIEKLPEWGSAQVFNWVPPVDIDKIVNHLDYYWVDDTTTPEYITIKNRCTTLTAQADFFQRLVDDNQPTFSIVGIDTAAQGSPQPYDKILINNDFTNVFQQGFEFFIKSSPNVDLNNTTVVAVQSTYNPSTNKTTIQINTPFTAPTTGGVASLEERLAQLEAERDDQCMDPVGPLGKTVNIPTLNQWISTNQWVHRTAVTNFSTAKQAAIPIIEYDDNMELNEWTCTNHVWKYRSVDAKSFTATPAKPTLVELKPLDFTSVGNEITLEEDLGDQTGLFVPGSLFITTANDIVEVVSSRYERASPALPHKTIITTASAVPGPSQIIPQLTSQGDTWADYHVHWLYVGSEPSVAMNHPTANEYLYEPQVQGSSSDYTFIQAPYSQTYTVVNPTTVFRLQQTPQTGWNTALADRAIKEANDIRVYLNGVRMFGGFNERTEAELPSPPVGADEKYVAGIVFDSTLTVGDVVRIEVGSASITDIGYSDVEVRTDPSDLNFGISPASALEDVSLITCRRVEQVKTDLNQYPLFDLYKTDYTSAMSATHLFGFKTSQASNVNISVGRRIVVDSTGTQFTFEQLMLGENDEIRAYRSYDKSSAQYWVDTRTNTVKFWNMYSWDTKGFQGGQYTEATVAPVEPTTGNYTGRIWYNTSNNTLYEYSAAMYVALTTDVVIQDDDPHLQTIWKAGLNSERYVPRKVDWKNRTLEEYNSERDEFVASYTNPTEGQVEWFKSQHNPLSPTGVWIGDWDIPDPLYYNNQHENRAELTTSELLTHFNSIKDAQPYQPGYNGPTSSRFHTLPESSVNFGVGGTIHEYNSAFDTFLSAVFVNNITPITLFEFARDQYEILLNSLRENLRDELYDLMLKLDPFTITQFQDAAIDLILTQFRQNDANDLVYGDSLTFVDNDGVNDLGLANWISTLPFFQLVARRVPEYLSDPARDINQIIHHDGHRRDYGFIDATKDGLIRRILSTEDTRTSGAKMGIQASTPPPTNITDFVAAYGTTINNRHGVYWYEVNPQGRTIYRLAVANAGPSQPSASLPNGTLWLDLTSGAEVLRIKNGLVWDIVKDTNGIDLIPGAGRLYNSANLTQPQNSTISAWEEFDLDKFLAGVVLAAEERLYETSPVDFKPVFDFASLQNTPARLAQYKELEEFAFLDYVRQSEIVGPFITKDYVATDAFTWNYRNSAPGQRYQIVSASALSNTFTLTGEVAANFAGVPLQMKVKNSGNNDGEWTITGATEGGGQTILTVLEPLEDSLAGIMYNGVLPAPTKNTGAESAGDWRSLYQQIYGTPYPHLEPWKLQGYVDKPTWWDTEYKSTSPDRRWTNTMWTNVAAGIVPTGYMLPDNITAATSAPGQTTPYDYVSVDTTTDALLAPYFAGPFTTPLSRSIFANIAEISAPAADSAFGQFGKIETDWRLSSQFLYDQLDIAFQMEPLETIASVFGFECNIVGELCVDSRTEQTPAHNRTIFHGEVDDAGNVLKVAGINQWYVNYNRYQGFDSSLSDFRRLWTDWTAHLTYQFGSYVDTSSFQLGHRTVPVSEFDYQILSKRSPGVEDYWLNALDVTVLSVPSNRSTDVQYEWTLEVNTNSPLTTSIEYYDVNNYKFLADPATDICQLYAFNITGVDFSNETIRVAGDQIDVFKFGFSIEITGSTGNDGTYVVESAVYDPTTNRTIVTLDSSLSSPTANGRVVVDYRKLPWQTGDRVWFTSTGNVPVPLIDEQPTIGPIVYFIIRVSDTEFKVANTQANALANIPIDLTSAGTGTTYVGELHSTFYALDRANTNNYWRHYTLDKTNILTFTPPTTITGIQRLIDITMGYSEYLRDIGFRFNDNASLSDPETGRHVSWQVELERFIDFAYSLQSRRNRTIGNRFEATVDPITDTWTWGTYSPNFTTGEAVKVLAIGGDQPTPILTGIRYYLINDTTTTFRLANSRVDALNGVAIDILDTPGSTLEIYKAETPQTQFPSQEINPFRNSSFFRPSRGVISNLITGPNEDIRTTQLLFDQYGEPLDPATVRIYRQDEQTHIQVVDGVENNRDLNLLFDDPYNYLHLGGAHLFIDTYEHVLLFNDETTEGVFLYDSFIGLNLTKFEMIFDRQSKFTQRPNVGGSYFLTNFNQGGSLRDNFEANVENIRYMYDVTQTNEGKQLTQAARNSVGYEGNSDYLSDLNLNQKSQFLFWRGLIQNKGAVTSIDAFINSRRFIDAKVDEFWAYKIAEFGSNQTREYPELYVNPDDVRFNDFRIQFVDSGDGGCIPGFGEGGFSSVGCGFDIVSIDTKSFIQNGITVIALSDQDRWFNQPDINSLLADDGGALYFNLKVVNELMLTTLTDNTIRHNFVSDFEVVTVETETIGTKYTVTATAGQTEVTIPAQYIPFAEHIRVFKNGSQATAFVDYNEVVIGTNTYSTSVRFNSPLSAGDTIEVLFNAATLIQDVHITRINANALRINQSELIDPSFTYTLWGYRVDYDSQNPANLIDRSNDTVLSPIQIWDPARGYDYQAVLPIINIRQDQDPANYTETLNPDQLNPGVNLTPWNRTEVGTVWYDTSQLGYVPYYDRNLFANEEEQLRVWGRQADWSRTKLYEWVESDVPPEEYNELAPDEVGDKEIPEHLRKSGRARETFFELVNGEWTLLTDRRQTFIAGFDGTSTPLTQRTYDFALDDVALNLSTTETNFVSVYVNGIARQSPEGFGFEVESPFVFQVDNLNGSDEVVFVNFKPSEQQIQQGEELGRYARRYEHTTVPYIDQFGQQQQRYYFWVENKITRNLNQSISPRSAEQQLTTIPVPYIVPSNPVNAERRASNFTTIDRTLQYNLIADDLIAQPNSFQISAQTQADYTSFIGGSTNLLAGYSVGDVITMTNNMKVTVDAINVIGDVTEFTVQVPAVGDVISPTALGPLMQSSVVDDNNNPRPSSLGFVLILAAENITNNKHFVTIGTPLQVSLRPGLTQDDFDEVGDNGGFIGGLADSNPSIEYIPGSKITLSNGAVVNVDTVDGNGDVLTFTIDTVGEPFAIGAGLNETIAAPPQTNSGFTLQPNVRNVQVTNVSLNGRELVPIVEYQVDITGRSIAINQVAGPHNTNTIAVEYSAFVPQNVVEVPERFTDIVIRGLQRFINEDRRYTVRFTRDFTLRDDINKGVGPMDLKQLHEQWTLIREEQPFKIHQELWTRLTESMTGYKLSDPTIAVPTLNRKLYDTKYNTDTRFGLGADQSFTDKNAAIATVQSEILNPNIVLGNSIDVSQFFETYNFDTPENIEAAMANIYLDFTALDVNRIFFATLHDAFSFKSRYAEIFKTSMIAVHGIRPFQTSGLFDD